MSGAVAIVSTLKAHDKLLYDVIKRQAGTLKKAITEGTMNSIEAGTDKILIKMWQDGKLGKDGKAQAFIHIEDFGIGIKTQEEIDLHFETFGQPHESTENTTWKQFRMGRGQMFAFGKNVWRTGPFQMEVDIERMGLDYRLMKGLPMHEGCVIDIELYANPIGDWQCRSIEALREEVQEQVRYVAVPVIFNGKQISVDPSTLNWDFEDDDAYYIFNESSTLKIYNLGIYVKSISQSQSGVGGIVVSKRQLKVNFARNDVQGDCEVFKRIRKIVQENKLKRATKKYRSLADGERYSLLRDLRDGCVKFDELSGKRLFKTAQGKWFSWNMIMSSVLPWTFSPEGDMVADKAMQMGAALCLSQGMLDELCYNGDKDCFFDWIMEEQLRIDKSKRDWDQNVNPYQREDIEKQLNQKRVSYLRYDKNDEVAQIGLPTLRSQFNEDYQLIARSDCTKMEKRLLDVLNYQAHGALGNRKICFGVSTVAKAWTDGRSYIALEKDWVRRLNLSSEGYILELFSVLAHELAHDENTAGSHIHGPQFYERYYELTFDRRWNNNIFYATFSFKKAMEKARMDEKLRKEDEKDKALKQKLGLVSTEQVAASS